MAGRRTPAGGFTILELVVVLAVLALVVALAAPRFARGIQAAALDSTARELLAGLKYTRSHAVSEHDEAVFYLNLEDRWFRLPGSDRRHGVPENLDMDLVTVESERDGEVGGAIRFFPDGSSTGGRVSLVVGERKRHVDVDWMGGRVRILDES